MKMILKINSDVISRKDTETASFRSVLPSGVGWSRTSQGYTSCSYSDHFVMRSVSFRSLNK